MGRHRILFAAGAFSLAAQTLLFRELLVAFHGSELGTGVFFATWLAWVTVGAMLGRRLPEEGRWAEWALLAYLPALAIQMWGFTHLRWLAAVPPAEVFPLERLAAWAVLLEAPCSLVTGLLFAGVAERQAAGSRSYAWESAGCFVGGAGFTLAVRAGLSPLATMGLFGVLVGVAALRRGTALAAGLAVALGLGLLAGGSALERAVMAGQVEDLLPGARWVDGRDTPQGRTAVARRADQVIVLRDGEVAAAYPQEADAAGEAGLVVAEAAGAGTSSLRVLLVGDHVEEAARALLRYDAVSAVTLVGPSREARALVAGALPAETAAALQDPRIEVVDADPRRWVQATPAGSFDAVVLTGGAPVTAAANRLHTAEFFRLVATALAPGGVLVTEVTAGSNYMGWELTAQGGSALATLEAVFSEVVVLPGDSARFAASPGAGVVSADPTVLARRHAALSGTSPLPDEAFHSLVDTDRAAFFDDLYRRPDPTGGSLVDTDERPISFTLALLTQGRFAGSGWVGAMQAIRAVGSLAWWVPLLTIAGLRLHRQLSAPRDAAPSQAAWVLGAAGFASMGLGVLLLFAFQARVGTLFSEVGALGAALLAGAAAGAAIGRLLTRRLAAGLPWAAMLALASIGAVALAIPPLLDLLGTGPHARAGLLALAALTGAVCGAAWPAAATSTSGRAAGALFAADHLGGALGALTVGSLLLPLAGLRGTCAMVAAVQGTVLLLVWTSRWISRDPVSLARWRARLRQRPGLAFPRLGTVATGVVLTAVVLGALGSYRLERPRLTFGPAELTALAPGARATRQDTPFVHYLGAVEGRTDHVVAASMAVRDDLEGYAGPINLRVVVDAQGTYRGVTVLESRETPAYMAEVVPWLASLVGRSVDEPLALTDDGGDVEVVTGATISARAALASLDATGAAVGGAVLGRTVEPRPVPPALRWEPGAIYLLVAIPLGLFVLLRGSTAVRSAFLLANGLVGGVWLNTQLSLETLAAPLKGHLPGLSSPVALLLLGGAALVTALFGAAWCGVLCPFGGLTEWLGRLGACRQVSPRADRLARAAKYFNLAVALTGFGLTSNRAWLSFDPLSLAFSGHLAPTSTLAGAFALGVLGVAVGTSVLWLRGWCRYLCPVGALLSLGNRPALLARRLLRRRYAACDLGVESPYDLDCLQCNRCLGTSRCRGPVVPQVERAASPPPGSPALLGAAVAVGLVLIAGAIATASGGDGRAGSGTVHDVDLPRLHGLIDEGHLSDQEALYWRVVDE